MGILKKLVVGLLALVVLLIAVAYVLPSRQSAERSRLMAATPDKLWPFIAEPRQWPKWSAWNQRDPDMKITYEGVDSGMGAKWTWESASQGNGSMTFDSAEVNRELRYTLVFPDMGSTATGRIALEPTGSGTQVTWSFETEMGNNPISRWIGLMVPGMVGKDFDAGLENLDKISR